MTDTGPLGLLFVYRVTLKLYYIVYVTMFFLLNISSKEFYKKFYIIIGRNGVLQGGPILHKRGISEIIFRFGNYMIAY